MIALSTLQSSPQTKNYNAILFIDTPNNAWYNQAHWLPEMPYLSIMPVMAYFNNKISLCQENSQLANTHSLDETYPEIGSVYFRFKFWNFEQQLILKCKPVVEFLLVYYKYLCTVHFEIRYRNKLFHLLIPKTKITNFPLAGKPEIISSVNGIMEDRQRNKSKALPH